MDCNEMAPFQAPFAETEEEKSKDWFNAVRTFHENGCKVPVKFLRTEHATDFGLNEKDAREFGRAVQSFDAKWQAAAAVYMQGKYATRKRFVSSGKFLSMGFSPSRDHGEVLRFALKFYEEEARYREIANSDAVSSAGRWGGTANPMTSPVKTRITHRATESEGGKCRVEIEPLPKLSPAEDSSSHDYCDTSTITCSILTDDRRSNSSERSKDLVHEALTDLCTAQKDSNMLVCMMFLVFAIVPLILFTQIESFLLFLAKTSDKDEGQRSNRRRALIDIDSEWEQLKRENALLQDDM